jgi:hypothetical protein
MTGASEPGWTETAQPLAVVVGAARARFRYARRARYPNKAKSIGIDPAKANGRATRSASVLGLGDQEADRRLGVDLLGELRQHHEHPLGRRFLLDHRADVHRHGFGLFQQFVDPIEIGMPPAWIVGRGFEPDLMADRIVSGRVEPEMRARETSRLRPGRASNELDRGWDRRHADGTRDRPMRLISVSA